MPGMTILRVISPGGLATVQDLGRTQWEDQGVPRAGAMDTFALQAANRLVGNPPSAAALELLGGGAEFEVLEGGLIAVCGADLDARLGGEQLGPWRATRARTGRLLTFGGRQANWGARAYLALAGGVDAPVILGSRSVYLNGGLGAALRMDDIARSGPPSGEVDRLAGQVWPADARPPYAAAPALRAMPGPHAAQLPGAFEWLLAKPFTVSPTSNRQGLRLVAEETFPHTLSLPSLGVLPGAVQLPPDGRPILLGADAQTTGGYPLIAMVIGADAPLAGQLMAGDVAQFSTATEAQALEALQAVQGWLSSGPVSDMWMDLVAAA